MSKCLLDGVEVETMSLIKIARKEYGYESPSGIYQTSIAARILRENGHTVEDCSKPERDAQ